MKAKSIKGRSPEEIRSALQQCLNDGFAPTLAIVLFQSVRPASLLMVNLEKAGKVSRSFTLQHVAG